LSKPSFEACYDRLLLIAENKGWRLPASRTLFRRIQREVPEAVQVLCRDGFEKLERMFPPMDRDRSHFHAMECLNADGHRWDVFVHDEKGEKPYRPLLLAIQDLYSGKFVGWRFAKSEGADTVRLPLAMCLETMASRIVYGWTMAGALPPSGSLAGHPTGSGSR
jgi:transposase InsO family protein